MLSGQYYLQYILALTCASWSVCRSATLLSMSLVVAKYNFIEIQDVIYMISLIDNNTNLTFYCSEK